MMKRLMAVALACAAIVVIGVLGFSEPGVSSSDGARLTRQADGTMVLADRSSNAPVLDIFEDFDCPVCKRMHANVDATIRKLAMSGQVKVVYHAVTIFRDEPMRSNSVRAAAAARCVPEANWMAFRDELYAMQPAPHGVASGFAVKDLAKAARKVGAQVDSCITSQAYAKAHLAETRKIRIEGTPTVLLDGQMLGEEVFDAAAMERVITGGVGVTV
ncbi:Protein-disulfide isomerase [Nonomuraea maritima]|uniref:Protein-disulfide isomerase n=1 Tax=Nonomuraea maritima TaxID=683260 RepID=A0A1G8VFB1_9ACTN|nr:thioredoxin domain-containing protein [Nonomuraea maritima]SDJ64776.1 Protein-disulfide isomerase [Nonomuraea maritima]